MSTYCKVTKLDLVENTHKIVQLFIALNQHLLMTRCISNGIFHTLPCSGQEIELSVLVFVERFCTVREIANGTMESKNHM